MVDWTAFEGIKLILNWELMALSLLGWFGTILGLIQD